MPTQTRGKTLVTNLALRKLERIQRATGWSWNRIARQVGKSHAWLSLLRAGKRSTDIYQSSREKINREFPAVKPEDWDKP